MNLLKRLRRCTELEMESVLGNLLRAGVLLAAAIVLTGFSLYLYERAFTVADFRTFKGEPTELRSVLGILRYATRMNAAGIMQLGLLVLMATPVARVAFSVFAFACQKDKVYVVVTLVVLSVLAYSLSGGTI